MELQVKRIYDPVESTDGTRILVDRIWPRGLRKEDARIDYWLKDIAPGTLTRAWFGHDPAKWDEFRRRYWRELDHRPAGVETLRSLTKNGPVTLLYAAKDTEHNNAEALKEYLRKHGRA